MYKDTLNISNKGVIVLPKKIRNVLGSNLVSLEVKENNQILLTPFHDIGGALASYQKEASLTFEEIRDSAWINSVHSTVDNKETK